MALHAMSSDNDLKDLQMCVSDARAELDTSSVPRGSVKFEGFRCYRRDCWILCKDLKFLRGCNFRVLDVTTKNDTRAVDTVK